MFMSMMIMMLMLYDICVWKVVMRHEKYPSDSMVIDTRLRCSAEERFEPFWQHCMHQTTKVMYGPYMRCRNLVC